MSVLGQGVQLPDHRVGQVARRQPRKRLVTRVDGDLLSPDDRQDILARVARTGVIAREPGIPHATTDLVPPIHN